MTVSPEYINYVEFVKSRFKTGADMQDDITHKVTASAVARCHAAMGIIGELIEAWFSSTRENLEEELGDTLFYIEALCQNLHSPFPNLHLVDPSPGGAGTIDTCWSDLIQSAGTLLDLSKKEMAYAKELSPEQIMEYRSSLAAVIRQFHRLAISYGYSFHDLAKSNEAKLTKRYKTGYSNEAAAERADKPAGE